METSNGETGNGISSCVHSPHGKRERNAVQKEIEGPARRLERDFAKGHAVTGEGGMEPN